MRDDQVIIRNSTIDEVNEEIVILDFGPTMEK